MKLNKKLIIISLLSFLTFNNLNCVSYKARSLEQLPVGSYAGQTISFNYKVFNKADCSKFLGRDKFQSRGYQPIQISFTNNSDRYFILSLANFSLPIVSHEDVAEDLHFNTFNRVLGWGIGSLFIWPLIIPAIVEGVQSPKANDKLDEDYARKALNNQVVNAFTTVNGIIFVPTKSYTNNFQFTVTDSQTNQQYLLSTDDQINDLSQPVITKRRLRKV